MKFEDYKPVGLLDASGRRGRLPRGLGGELLPGGLASGGLPRGLLGTGHGEDGDVRVRDFGLLGPTRAKLELNELELEMGWGKEEEVAEN